jgi:hypothetical protein
MLGRQNKNDGSAWWQRAGRRQRLARPIDDSAVAVKLLNQ